MQTLTVDLGSRAYPIHIGHRPAHGDLLSLTPPARRALLVSDAHVAPRYATRWQRALEGLGIDTRLTEIPPGESSKSLTWAGRLYTAAAEAGLDRRSLIVALGGGVVGDLAGFVSATYLRGIRLIQAPTTLLAMVDSSVGGKTAINIAAGKNLVGAFHQPAAVIADLATLDSLPGREYRSGLAEVLKYGAIHDAAFFAWLEDHVDAILARDPPTLEALVARCCAIKAEVVATDERESGLRAILNFGHTLGHAVETVAGYGQRLHGEAVALGMVFAARLSCRQLGLDTASCRRLVDLLERLALPVQPPTDMTWQALRHVMDRDKKAVDGAPRFVLLKSLGQAAHDLAVADSTLQREWEDWT